MGEMVHFRVRLLFAILAIAFFSSSAGADDVGAAARGVVRIIAFTEDSEDISVSFGSGFAISPHRVITNAHVLEAAQNSYAGSLVAVVPAEGKKAVNGTVVAYDRTRDLAVVDVGEARLEPLTIYSGPVESGGQAAALGYPGNVDLATARSMYDLIVPSVPVRSQGNISGERSVEGKAALLHTAAISRGNSGGPLVDECGRVLGVNTYTTLTDSGDAPFGFAVVSKEVMSFLRDQGQTFQQIGSACVTLAEQQQQERLARDSAAREDAAKTQREAQAQQGRVDDQKAEIQDVRENHVAGAAILGVLALVAGVLGTAFYMKGRERTALAAGVAATLALAGSAYAFFSRPSLHVIIPEIARAPASTQLTGKLLCQVRPELSRVTVSSTNDLPMSWDSNGCMNDRTQYASNADSWRRVLVPNGSETVSIQEFIPAKREFTSTRYLLPQSEMDRIRAIRGRASAKGCASDAQSLETLSQVTEDIVSALPSKPNEKLVYRCESE